MSAVHRRHFDQQEAVQKTNLRVIVAAPHKQIGKTMLTQVVTVM